MNPSARTGVTLFMLVVCALAAWLIKVSLSPDPPLTPMAVPYVEDNGLLYLNTAEAVSYVGMDACADCHPEIYDSYLDAEMGHSLELLSEDNIIETYPQKEAVYDSTLDHYYEMVRRDNRFYQREFRLGANGEVIHERLVEAHVAFGSGNNLRMYFHNEGGMLYELPLTWYVHQERWEMSPGYRDYQNLRFSRFATPKCLACHNAYLEPVEESQDRYREPFELGIGCERCHGPGELHVRQKRGEQVLLPSANARTIVNPRKLSSQRQLDVCRQCHLQGKAWALQPGKGWFDYRPGMLLASHRSVYFPQRMRKEVFEVADAAQRLAVSRCFTESEGVLTCISCHDPHRSIKTFTRAHYNDACLSCHAPARLSARTRVPPHTSADDCVSCHMNRTGTDNTLHGVSTTDHWIRVNANQTPLDWSLLKLPDDQKPRVTLTAEVDADDAAVELRRGTAYLDYYRERDSRRPYLDSARVYLDRAMTALPKTPVVHDMLGAVYQELGEYKQAIAALKRAVELAPGRADFHARLGQANLALNRPEPAAANFQRALQLRARVPEYLESLGNALATLGRTEEAIDALQKALQIDQQNPYALYRLGNLYVFDRQSSAMALPYFERVVTLDPDFPNGALNLGNAYVSLGRYAQAIAVYEKELYLRPRSPFAAANLGRAYALHGDTTRALLALQKALALDPALAGAQELLEALTRD